MGRVKQSTGLPPSGKKQKKADAAPADVDAAHPGLDGLPERLKHQHNFVTCGADVNTHVGASRVPGTLSSSCCAQLHRQYFNRVL